jgi:hypothetical protein
MNSESKYNFGLKLVKTVETEWKFGSTINKRDNVLISGTDELIKLPKIASDYMIYDFLKSRGLETLAQIIDKNEPCDESIINSCPQRLVEFIRQFIAVLRKYKIPDVHNQLFEFTRLLQFCVVASELMKKNGEGLHFLIPFTTVRAFYKNEKAIKMMFNDILRCAYGFDSIKTYPVKIMFGTNASDITELHKECYQTVGVPLPSK